jgi:hypothetical protein
MLSLKLLYIQLTKSHQVTKWNKYILLNVIFKIHILLIAYVKKNSQKSL